MRWLTRLHRIRRLARARARAAAPGITIGPGTQLKGRLVHHGPGEVVIGAGCRIGMGLRAGRLIIAGPGRVEIGDGCTIDAAEIHTLHKGATITIGAGCYLNRVEMAAGERIAVGERCEIGSAVIYDTDFHSVQRAPRGQVRTGAIVIGDDVWIAARTAVLRGVTVGDRAVIGMGVVVSGDVDADTLLRPGSPRRSSLPPEASEG